MSDFLSSIVTERGIEILKMREVIAALLADNRRLFQHPRWIPVGERLPEEENHAPGAAATSIDVIAINKYGSPIIAYCILQDSATDKKGEWFATHNDTLISDGVYFWTYKPPEVKND